MIVSNLQTRPTYQTIPPVLKCRLTYGMIKRLMHFNDPFNAHINGAHTWVRDIPYSTKHWREKSLADLAVDSQSANAGFLSPRFCISSALKMTNLPMFSLPKILWALIRQSFRPPKFCAIRYDGSCYLMLLVSVLVSPPRLPFFSLTFGPEKKGLAKWSVWIGDAML